MDSITLLYPMVKLKLSDEYSNVSFQSQKDDTPGSVGVYLYESSNDKKSINGEVVYNSIKVQVQVICDRSYESLANAMDYLTEFVDRIESEKSDIPKISIISAEHIGPKAIPIGRNRYDLQVVKSTIDLKYSFNNF